MLAGSRWTLFHRPDKLGLLEEKGLDLAVSEFFFENIDRCDFCRIFRGFEHVSHDFVRGWWFLGFEVQDLVFRIWFSGSGFQELMFQDLDFRIWVVKIRVFQVNISFT